MTFLHFQYKKYEISLKIFKLLKNELFFLKDQAMKNKWSAKVTKNSNALDVKATFSSTMHDPEKIARSLKKIGDQKAGKKSPPPFQPAMSILNFYINRAGNNLQVKQKHTL